MLYKESIGSLEETPLRTQKTLTEIKVLKDNTPAIKEVILKDKPDIQKIVSTFLHIQESKKKIHAHLKSLENFISEQISVVENDCNSFDETVSKSALLHRMKSINEDIDDGIDDECEDGGYNEKGG